MKRLEGRIAIITGAGAGIGKGVARRYAAEAATLLLADCNAASVEQTAAEIQHDFGSVALALCVDVSKRDQVDSMVNTALARWGQVDILVNNAWGRRPGGGNLGRIENKPDEDLYYAFDIAVMSAWWAMRCAFPSMQARRWGRVINMCSLNGVNAHPYSVDYNMAKEALRTLTRSAAREWAPYQICCNAICPGAATEAYRRFATAQPENAAAMLKLNPMGRMGDPEIDIGGVALFLASDDCCYITGNTLYADGGSHINGVPWVPDVPA